MNSFTIGGIESIGTYQTNLLAKCYLYNLSVIRLSTLQRPIKSNKPSLRKVEARKFPFFECDVHRTLLILFLLCIIGCPTLSAQYGYGTTGLLNMPTADMQRDKTVMIGGSYLEKHTSPGRWHYNTLNYYFNATILPWVEVAYDLTLFKALENDMQIGRSFGVPSSYGKFVNQDRNFAVRIRLWKEGWWKSWTPQIVIGGNDVVHSSGAGASHLKHKGGTGNGYCGRYYIAATKHFAVGNIGVLGAHLSYLYNDRDDYPLNNPAFGANFQFALPETEEGITWQKALNGLNLMAEFYPANNEGVHYVVASGGEEPGRGVHIGKWDVNVGGSYTVWKDYINFYAELYGCRYFSGGIQFKLHLR